MDRYFELVLLVICNCVIVCFSSGEVTRRRHWLLWVDPYLEHEYQVHVLTMDQSHDVHVQQM